MAELVVFSFDVPEEKQAEYLKATSEKIKPFWEAHGCLSYDVWQTEEGSPAFIKTMLQESSRPQGGGGPGEEAKAAVQLFESFVVNLSRKTYTKRA